MVLGVSGSSRPSNVARTALHQHHIRGWEWPLPAEQGQHLERVAHRIIQHPDVWMGFSEWDQHDRVKIALEPPRVDDRDAAGGFRWPGDDGGQSEDGKRSERRVTGERGR
jgi:hypothetical protein